MSTPFLRVSVVTPIKAWGGRVSWSRTNQIAIDKLGWDLYYDVHVMNAGGFWLPACLTCGNGHLPQRHLGNPEWHPNGRHLFLQAQKLDAPIWSNYFANPGAGLNNDIWVLDTWTGHAAPLTDVAMGLAVLHPHVSPDGWKLCWAECVEASGSDIGVWAIKVGELQLNGDASRVVNVQTYQPGLAPRFYETHGFSLDGQRVLFSGNPDNQIGPGGDIYWLDLATGLASNLTNSPAQWDEHAQLRPQGDWIVWMSSQGAGGRNDAQQPRTDYWAMHPDGSDAHQLTFFNDPSHPHFIGGGVTAADAAWSPDGSKLLAYLIQNVATGAAKLVQIAVEA